MVLLPGRSYRAPAGSVVKTAHRAGLVLPRGAETVTRARFDRSPLRTIPVLCRRTRSKRTCLIVCLVRTVLTILQPLALTVCCPRTVSSELHCHHSSRDEDERDKRTDCDLFHHFGCVTTYSGRRQAEHDRSVHCHCHCHSHHMATASVAVAAPPTSHQSEQGRGMPTGKGAGQDRSPSAERCRGPYPPSYAFTYPQHHRSSPRLPG